MPVVKVKKLREDIILPSYSHPGDAGMDACNAGEDLILEPFSRALVPTGIKVAIPRGYEIQVRPRSGNALKKGITVLNTPGTIDTGYRGEIGVIIFNADSRETVVIKRGERVAQLVLNKVEEISWQEVECLDETVRNAGGFGSTG